MTDTEFELANKLFDSLSETHISVFNPLIQSKIRMPRHHLMEAVEVLRNLGLVEIKRFESNSFQVWLTSKGREVKNMVGGFTEFCRLLELKSRKNYKLTVLEYLADFEGDGLFYNVDHLLLEVGSVQKRNIIEDLLKDGHIEKERGTGMYPAPERMVFSTNWDGLQNALDSHRNKPRGEFIPYKIKINSKGAEYLENKNNMKNKGHVTIGTINASKGSPILIHSPGSVVNVDTSQKAELIGIVEKIIEKLQEEQSVSKHMHEQTLLFFATLIDHLRIGEVKQVTLPNLLDVSDKLSSVGSFALPLVKELIGHVKDLYL